MNVQEAFNGMLDTLQANYNPDMPRHIFCQDALDPKENAAIEAFCSAYIRNVVELPLEKVLFSLLQSYPDAKHKYEVSLTHFQGTLSKFAEEHEVNKYVYLPNMIVHELNSCAYNDMVKITETFSEAHAKTPVPPPRKFPKIAPLPKPLLVAEAAEKKSNPFEAIWRGRTGEIPCSSQSGNLITERKEGVVDTRGLFCK